MALGPLEVKAAAGPSTTLVAGYLSALAIETIPWLRDNLTPDQQANLPIILAFALSALAAYLAPHTHRPDLAPVTPAPVRVIEQPPPDAGDSE